MKLSESYVEQRNLERLIQQGKQFGWVDQVQEGTRKLNELLAFRDAVTELGSVGNHFPRGFPQHLRR